MPSNKTNHSFFKITFAPSTIIEWNKLASNTLFSPPYKLFRTQILEFLRPCPNTLGLPHLTMLRVGLNYVYEHEFCHTFQDYLKGTFNYYMITECPKFERPFRVVPSCSILVALFPLERSKLNLNPSPDHFLHYPSQKQFCSLSFKACFERSFSSPIHKWYKL